MLFTGWRVMLVVARRSLIGGGSLVDGSIRLLVDEALAGWRVMAS
ncbi:hypothetical protein [uncultured Mobiluncus sp.]|nr:hypothetical protein [uncultured Mobiluncus sp.]